MSYHLLIIGGGSAAITAAKTAIDRGCRVTLAHAGLPIGGSCLHVGCVPSKFMIRAAETNHHAHHSRFPGLEPKGTNLDFATVMREQRALVTELRETNYEATLPHIDGLELHRGYGKIAGPKSIEVNGQIIEGDGILLATGSSSALPPIPGLAESPVWTNENLFEQSELPESLIVIGGGYIALEAAQMIARFGCKVTVLQRSEHILSDQPADLGETVQEQMRAEGMNIITGVSMEEVRFDNGFTVKGQHQGSATEWSADKIFVGLGRAGNSGSLNLDAVGIQTHGNGFIQTNAHLETDSPGIYAVGDLLGGKMFVYTASHEAECAVDGLLGSPRSPDYHAMPWVVFTDPQVAGCGLTLEEAKREGYDADDAVLPVTRWPRFRVSRHTRGYLQLIRDKKTNTLLGARAAVPEGGDLMSELSLIIRHKISLSEISEALYPYLTLSEGIQRCVQRFED